METKKVILTLIKCPRAIFISLSIIVLQVDRLLVDTWWGGSFNRPHHPSAVRKEYIIKKLFFGGEVINQACMNE